MSCFLMIDTCGTRGSVAWQDSESRQGDHIELEGRSYAETLMDAINQTIKMSGLELRDFSALVVVNGPGSFTGIRVGVATVKGLSEASGVPIIAISRLAVMPWLKPERASPVQCVLDAGRGEFYYARFRDQQNEFAPLTEYVLEREALMTREELFETLRVAEGSVRAYEPSVLEALQPFHPIKLVQPLAQDALVPATVAYLRKQFVDTALLDGHYLRKPDAELFSKLKKYRETA